MIVLESQIFSVNHFRIEPGMGGMAISFVKVERLWLWGKVFRAKQIGRFRMNYGRHEINHRIRVCRGPPAVVLGELEVVSVGGEELHRAALLLEEERYLGAARPVGRTLVQAVHHRGRWVALLVWGPAALKLPPLLPANRTNCRSTAARNGGFTRSMR